MAKIPGLNISAPVVPLNDTDTYPSHRAMYGQGGWQEVATIADRDAITAPRREAGMAVFVISEQKVYILDNDLVTWNLLESGKVDDVLVNGTSVVTNKVAEIEVPEVIDSLDSTSTTNALSANQGKVLYDTVQSLSGRGRYLTLWDCSTGLAETNPPVSPYEYKNGDYFIVGTVAEVGGTNYRPTGSFYTTGTASTVVETEPVDVNDTYIYDGTTWHLQMNTQKEVAFSSIAGSPYDNNDLANALNAKQDIIQVPSMPQASSTNLGQIVQYIGATTENLTNGYFYKCVSDGENPPTYSWTNINVQPQTSLTWGNITGNISNQTDLVNYVDENGGKIDLIQKNGTDLPIENKTVNIEVPEDAAGISYHNSTYPTVEAALDKLLYVAPSVTISGGGTYEIGYTKTTTTLTWSWNKAIVSQSLNQGIGSLGVNVRTYTYETPITANTTFTITGSDGTQSKSASTSVTFQPKRYWGVSASTSLTDEQILALSQELSTSRVQTRTFNCSGGKYFYFVIRTEYCSGIKFKVGGLAFSDMIVTTRNVVNAQGYTASYNIYRVNNIQTGSAIVVEVS